MLFFIYFIITVSFIDTMAQLPILSPYIFSLGASAIFVGIIMGTYSLVNMLGNLGAGLIIDNYGRKISIVAGLLLAGTAVFCYSLATTPEQLLVFRIFHGIGGAILIPGIFTYLGDRAVKYSLGKAMGYSGAAVGIAAFLGPMLSGMGKDLLGIEKVFIIIGLTLIFTAILVIIFLPETFVRKEGMSQKVSKKEIIKLIKDIKLQTAYLAALGLTFCLGVLAYYMPLAVEELGFASKDVGILFSIFSFTAIVIFVSPFSRLWEKEDKSLPIYMGLIFMGFVMFMLPKATTFISLAVLMFLYGLGFGFVFPSMTATVVANTDMYYRGTAFGIFYAVYSFGVFVGPIFSGIAISFEYNPFYIAAALVFLVLIFLQGKYKKIKQEF